MAKTVSIIGSGRLGTALGRALAKRGYLVELVVARHLESARRAARLIPGGPAALASEQVSSRPASDITFLTTPDSALAAVAAHLATLPPAPGRRARVVLHTSGVLASEVLTPLAQAGYAVGSLHPLLSVSDPASGAEAFGQAYFCLEGQPRAVRQGRALVRALGARSFTVATADKPLYHAAAVLACGHLVALFDCAAQMLALCGLPEEQGRQVLLPLVASTVANLSRQTPAAALTGPLARADVPTIQRHLVALEQAGLPVTEAIYRLLGQHALGLARAQGADAAKLDEIAQQLATPA